MFKQIFRHIITGEQESLWKTFHFFFLIIQSNVYKPSKNHPVSILSGIRKNTILKMERYILVSFGVTNSKIFKIEGIVYFTLTTEIRFHKTQKQISAEISQWKCMRIFCKFWRFFRVNPPLLFSHIRSQLSPGIFKKIFKNLNDITKKKTIFLSLNSYKTLVMMES